MIPLFVTQKKWYLTGCLVFSLLFSTWSYATWMSNLVPLESNRLIIYTTALFLSVTIANFWVLIRVIIPGISVFSASERRWFWLACLLLGTLLYISTVDFDNLKSKYIYFLLPRQTLEVRVPEKKSQISLLEFSTSLGGISFNQMKMEGWKRDEQNSKTLLLDNNQTSHLTWVGQTGSQAVLQFKTSISGRTVNIIWNGTQKSYNLFSLEDGTLKVSQDFRVPFYAGWQLLAGMILPFFWLGVCVLFLLVLKSKATIKMHKTNRGEWVWYALPMLTIWGFFWMVFFPGFLTADSIRQWEQVVSGHYIDWHSPLHTMTIWLITRVWNSPGAVSLLQLVAMSATLGWGLAVLRRIGTPTWLTWVTAILLAVMPANATYAITLWKDIPFSILVVVLSILTLEIVLSGGRWLEKKANWVLLGVILALVTILRQNGILVSLGTAAALGACFSPHWKKLGLSVLLFIALFVFVEKVLYKIVDVKSANMARVQIALYNLAVAHQDGGTIFTQQEETLMSSGFPQGWRLDYECLNNYDLKVSIESNPVYRDYLAQNTGSLVKLALNLTLRSPARTISHFACTSAFVFRMFQNLGKYKSILMEISQNNFGLKETSFFPKLRIQFNDAINDTYAWNWLLWRSSFWMMLLLVGCVGYCLRRKSAMILLVLLPSFLVALPMLFLSFSQTFRYVYAIYLCGIILSGYFWANALAAKIEGES